MRWLGAAGDDHSGRIPARTRAASGGYGWRRSGTRRRLRAPRPDSLRGEGEGDGAELVGVLDSLGEAAVAGDLKRTAAAVAGELELGFRFPHA